MAKKQPLMSNYLFDLICKKLKEKGQLPEILEYSLADDLHPFPVDSYECDVHNNLDFGGCEGIYLSLSLYIRGEEKRFGTFKTLAEDREGMVEMGKLLANFLVEFRDYVDDNMDDFTWDGFDVRGIKYDGTERSWAVECATLERALEHKQKMLEDGRYKEVIIRNNRTREETSYKCPFKPFKTDDGQMLLKVDGKSYTFAEVRECWADEEYDEDYYAVFSATVDLNDYNEGEVDEILHHFYSDGYKEVLATYPNNADQITAECIFEELLFSDVTCVSKGAATEEDADKLLEEYADEYYRKEVDAA